MSANTAKRILVVDDEPQIHRFLKPSLIVSGYEVLVATTGAQSLRMLGAPSPDAIILDLGLPDMDGKDVITAIRKSSDAPIIILSARDREAEKIAALDLGADDYVNKPFAIGELLARLRSVLRRPRGNSIRSDETNTLAFGAITIDVRAHEVFNGATRVHLTPKEFDLLLLLAKYLGRVLTHKQILTEIWGGAHHADTQYLRVFIGQLRQKLEVDPSSPRLILTEPGIGYRAVEQD